MSGIWREMIRLSGGSSKNPDASRPKFGLSSRLTIPFLSSPPPGPFTRSSLGFASALSR